MPQSGFTPVQTYSSSTPGNVPLAANLINSTQGAEMAINIADGKLFYKNSSGVVTIIATNGTAVIGGSTTQVQYNNGGVLAGSANLTFNGTTLTANTLNLTNALGVAYGGTGQTTFTAGQVLYGNGTSGLSTSANMTFDGSTLTTLNSAYTGTLTGGTGIVNLGSGQFYKDASGNVGIGTSSPAQKLSVVGNAIISGDLGITVNTVNGDGINLTNSSSTSYATLQVNGSNGSGVGGWANSTVLEAVSASTGGLVLSAYNNNIIFQTGSRSERMRIDSSGNLLVGVTANDLIANRTTGFAVGPSLAGGQEMIIRASLGAKWSLTATSATHMYFYSDNGSAAVSGGNISTNGSVTSFNVTSDYRLKQNIVSLQNSLNKVLQLKPCSYNFIEGNQYSEGFIAHELQEIIPQAVTGQKDAIKEDGTPDYQAVDASFLIPHLVSAIQEQQALIENLTTRLTALENK